MTYLLCELDEHIVHISLHISLQHDFEQFVHHLMINVYYINQTKRHKPIIEKYHSLHKKSCEPRHEGAYLFGCI